MPIIERESLSFILPQEKKEQSEESLPIVVVIGGYSGSGKSSFSEYLQNYADSLGINAATIETGKIISDLYCREKGLATQDEGIYSWLESLGPLRVTDLLKEGINKTLLELEDIPGMVILSGARHNSVIDLVNELFPMSHLYYLWAEADFETRFKRINKRNSLIIAEALQQRDKAEDKIGLSTLRGNVSVPWQILRNSEDIFWEDIESKLGQYFQRILRETKPNLLWPKELSFLLTPEETWLMVKKQLEVGSEVTIGSMDQEVELERMVKKYGQILEGSLSEGRKEIIDIYLDRRTLGEHFLLRDENLNLRLRILYEEGGTLLGIGVIIDMSRVFSEAQVEEEIAFNPNFTEDDWEMLRSIGFAPNYILVQRLIAEKEGSLKETSRWLTKIIRFLQYCGFEIIGLVKKKEGFRISDKEAVRVSINQETKIGRIFVPLTSSGINLDSLREVASGVSALETISIEVETDYNNKGLPTALRFGREILNEVSNRGIKYEKKPKTADVLYGLG